MPVATGGGARGAAALTVTSLTCVQLSDAWSVPLLGTAGAAGTAWLRATSGALVLLALVRPRVRRLTAQQWRAVVPLGLAGAVLSACFLAALERLPLGTVVAVEFLGPLALAVRTRGRGRLLWPAMALAGVLALTRPWRGDADPAGLALAAAGALAWAACIVLTARVGRCVQGLHGVALALPVTAACLTPRGAATAVAHLDAATACRALGLAVLMPVLPSVLELIALRRLPAATFATLTALEPALAAAVGAIVLHQRLGLPGALGIALVVAGGAG
ncbi:EamA family transporter, partial [Kineococcus indalonis]|uniref:EamA family transporter n=1 Tax=Kineococcus indalonis TaxID=2696566 RepID=UPI0014127B28